MIKQYTRIYYIPGQVEPVAIYTGDLPLSDDFEPITHTDGVYESFDVVIDIDEVDHNFSLRQQIMRPRDMINTFDVADGTATFKDTAHPKILCIEHKDCRESAIRAEICAALDHKHGKADVDSLRNRPMVELIQLNK